MKVLVTGAAGMVGRHAIIALQAAGVEVHAVGRGAAPPAHVPRDIPWHAFDLLHGDPRTLVATVRPQAILHFAWVTAHGAVWSSPDNLNWTAASLRLLRAFAEAGGKRFVSAGTCAEYNWSRLGDGVCREDTTPLGSAFLYGVAKDAFRRCAERYAETAGLTFAWGRIFHVFGDGESPARLVPSVIAALSAGRRAEVSHGNQVRDFASARQVGAAFCRLLLTDARGSFNVASGRPVTLRDLIATIVARIGGEVAFGAVASDGREPPVLVADVSRLAAAIGFVPDADLRAEIDLLLDRESGG